MKRVPTRPAVIAAIALAAAVAAPASAAPIYWDGTGTSWTANVSAWSTDPVDNTQNPLAVPGASDDVIFGYASIITAQSLTLGANAAANSLTFNSATGVTYTITGSGANRNLTIGSGGLSIAAGSGQIIIGTASANQNIFVKMDASQTWTNNSTALLQIRNNLTGSSTASGPIVWTANAASTGDITDSGALNDGNTSVAVVVASTGTGAVNIGGGDYSGGTTIKSGTLSGGGFGTGAILLGDTTGSLNATLRAAGSITVSNNITAQAGSSLNTLTISNSGTNSTPTFSGTITLDHDVLVSPGTGATMTFSSVVSGAGSLTKSGTTLVLSGPNTYTGSTSITAGTLRVSSINSVSGGAAVLPSSSLGAPTDANAAVISIGATNASGTLVYTGTGETTNRGINLPGTTGGAVLDQSGTGLLKFTSNLTAPGVASVDNRKILILQGSTAGTGEFAGAIVNSTLGTPSQLTTGVTKNGTSTWTLSGNNSYSGLTNINGGKLLVTGTHTAAGTYTVNNTGTFAGNATITGTTNANFVVASGGKLSPGGESTPGTLTLNLSGTGRLNLSATAPNNAGQFTFRLGTLSDKINLATGLTLGTATADNLSLDWSDFNFVPGSGFANGIYTLVDANINVSGGLSTGVGLLSGAIGGGTGTLSISGSQDLILTVSGIASTANLTINPTSGNRTSGQTVTITNNNGGTYDISGSSATGSGWSQSGIANGTGLTSSPVGTLTHNSANAINGSNQGRYTFTVANSANADGAYNYTLSSVVSGNVAPYNVAQTATILAGNTLTGYSVDAARNLGNNQLGTLFTIQDSLALVGDKNLSMTIRERINGTADDETTANDGLFDRFASDGGKLFSDVVSIDGINGTVYVLTIAYDPADLDVATEASRRLGWLNGSTQWVNAVQGNTGGTAFFAGDISWQVGIGGDGLQLGDLGKYGVYTNDVGGNYVWAVLNHNSEFAVIPEPASLGLLALGGFALVTRRRRN